MRGIAGNIRKNVSKKHKYMATFYKRVIINDRTEHYIADEDVKLIIESAETAGGGTEEFGYFKLCETDLTESQVEELDDIEEIDEQEWDDYVDNMNGWLNSVVGSHPPSKPRP